MSLGSRIVIVGASGSGKTTLARKVGQQLSLRVLELDPVHWSGRVGTRRNESEALQIVSDFASGPRWVVEGVYGWLVAPAVARADCLIWLDVPWHECREGLAARGPWAGASDREHAEFLAWAEAYWTRETSSSFAGHRAIFETFAGKKLRLRSHEAVDGLRF